MAKFKYVAGLTGDRKPVLQEVKVGTGKGQCAKGEGLCDEHPTLKQWEKSGGANKDIFNIAFVDDDFEGMTLSDYNKKSHECDLPRSGSRYECEECGKVYQTFTVGEGETLRWQEDTKNGVHQCKTPTTAFKRWGTEWTCKDCGELWEVTSISYGGDGGSEKIWGKVK